MQSDKVLNLPAGYFGIVLGTIGMGFAWRYASQVWQVSHWLGDGLVILAMIIWGLLTSAFIGGDWFCSVVSPTGGVPVQFWCRGSVGLCRLANCGIMARISP